MTHTPLFLDFIIIIILSTIKEPVFQSIALFFNIYSIAYVKRKQESIN